MHLIGYVQQGWGLIYRRKNGRNEGRERRNGRKERDKGRNEKI